MQVGNINSQRGYVLLLVVLMFMSIGGVVLAGFTQQARDEFELKRYQHNQRVLEQAKQALLMFAYNYPQSNNRGPGRLPCPDHDDDGLVDFPLDCDTVGRFPWSDPRLSIQQTLDASGETLWYAVSDAFDNEAGGVVNSDTLGSITLVDQSGGILYDGAVAGIAAVIIAPGPVLKRDNDANGTYEFTQLRATGAQQIDPRNYLDTFNGFDNSVFTNDESDTNDDGFILGPVYDNAENEIVVNDQIIIITADEVIAMAEKAVLEAHANAIEAYQQNIWVLPANYRFPWLSAYDHTTVLNFDVPMGTGVNMFDARPGETTGRVPFLNYFTDHDSHAVITNLDIDFEIDLTYVWLRDNADPDPTYIDVFGAMFAAFPVGPKTASISRSNLSFEKISFDGLQDVIADDVGTLVAQEQTGAIPTAVTATPSSPMTQYFWDGCPTCTQASPADGWQLCPFVNGDETDCARTDVTGAAFQQPFLGWNNHFDMKIRKIDMVLEVDSEFILEIDYSVLPTSVTYTPPDGGTNARFETIYPVAAITDLAVTDVAETSARNFVDLTIVCEQDDLVEDSFNIPSSNPDPPNSLDCGPILNLDLNRTFTFTGQVEITADYYPPLPQWVAENNWDDAVMMSYMFDFAPGPTTASCTPEDGDTGTGMADDCLVITNLGGINNDFSGLLVIAGEHDLVDDGVANFQDDLADIFEPENNDVDLVFDRREQAAAGNSGDTVFPLGRL